jgi:ligand-binding sensor domain-containing protein
MRRARVCTNGRPLARVSGLSMLCVWLVLLLICSAAQSAPASNVRFRLVGVSQGLSQVSAATILQDRHGFLWVGTQDGLNRYDGYEFQVYRHRSEDAQTLKRQLCARVGRTVTEPSGWALKMA